jgi:hypothetical protein
VQQQGKEEPKSLLCSIGKRTGETGTGGARKGAAWEGWRMDQVVLSLNLISPNFDIMKHHGTKSKQVK